MEKKSNERKKNLSTAKKRSLDRDDGGDPEARKDGSDGDPEENVMRPGGQVRTGKTGATGIIRETGLDGDVGKPDAFSSDKKIDHRSV